MGYKLIQLEKSVVKLPNEKETTLAKITLNAPPVNALSPALLTEMSQVIQQVEKEQGSVLIITGAGKSFIAGADISVMKDFSKEQAQEFGQMGQEIINQFANSHLITIAAINGFALGGGLEFALACDIRIFSDKAVVGLPEVGLGVVPAFGGTQRLPRIIGEGNAKYFTITGSQITPDEALRMGITQKITTPESLMKEAEGVACEILAKGPQAVRSVKKLVQSSFEHDLPKGFSQERETFAELFHIKEANEGLTAFVEKRPARFQPPPPSEE